MERLRLCHLCERCTVDRHSIGGLMSGQQWQIRRVPMRMGPSERRQRLLGLHGLTRAVCHRLHSWMFWEQELDLGGSSVDQVGQLCVQVVDRLLTQLLNLVSGCDTRPVRLQLADQAHPAAGEVLCGAPSGLEFTISDHRSERLRLLEVTEAHGPGGCVLEWQGPKELWRGYVGREAPWSAPTSS